MMNKSSFFIVVFFVLVSQLTAQDYHLSQYDVASLYLNPATAGSESSGSGAYKLYASQRSQWRSAGIKPFISSYLGFDMPYYVKGKKIGVGAYILNNNAGIGNFNTFNFMLGASYDILSYKERVVSSGAKPNNHSLCMGLQMGFFYRSTNSNALNYDSQYNLANNGGDFDPSLPSNESFERLNITRFDANYGLRYRYLKQGARFLPGVGFAMAHLTKPNDAMTGGQSRQAIKWTGYASVDIRITEKLACTPRLLCQVQARAQELMLGALLNYKLNDKDLKILGGIDLRHKDALIVSVGFLTELIACRISYDFTTSYLRHFNNSRGAYELSLIYSGNKHRKSQTKTAE